MGLQLLTWTVRRLQAPAAAASDGATLTITVGQVPTTRIWRVEGIVAACTSSTATSLSVYDRPPPYTGVVPCQGTRVGNFTVDDQASPLTILGGDVLTLVWRNCSAGAIARARVQIAVYGGTAAAATPVAL